ncbi:MAG: hypothetical protein HOW73_34675 [Polyangiaceae bacterium]|nr:hypothetical protein [Polyangiaceae bacterium]
MSDDVILNQLDNQLGLVDDGGRRAAVCACAAAGPLNTPGIYARKSDIIDTFVSGRLVEAGVWIVENTGRPVVLCRTEETTAGAYGTVDDDGVVGTSVITAHVATQPYDDYEVRVDFVAGGTVGTAGITYMWSLDDGRTPSAVTSLGVANFITIADGNVRLDLGAGTIVAGDFVKVRTTGPKPNATQLGESLDVLKETENRWKICLVDVPCTSGDFGTIDSAATAMLELGDEPRFVTAFRVPDIGETEQAYKAAFDAEFGSSVSQRIVVGAGAAEYQSPVSQRRLLGRLAADIVACVLPLPLGQDPARVRNGPRPATINIKDASRNKKHHDELLNPGLDGSRATTYTTRRRRRGIYYKNVRVMSGTGSDFRFWQHLDVMAQAREIARRELELFGSEDVFVNAETGFILEEDATHIEEVINAALETELGDAVSKVEFQLARNDNILSTFTLHGALRVTPKGYVKHIEVDVGFYNPALNVVTDDEGEG